MIEFDDEDAMDARCERLFDYTDSAKKHGIRIWKAVNAMEDCPVYDTLDDGTLAFVGHPYEGALEDDFIEVLVDDVRPKPRIFHVMPLTDNFRYLVYLRPDWKAKHPKGRG